MRLRDGFLLATIVTNATNTSCDRPRPPVTDSAPVSVSLPVSVSVPVSVPVSLPVSASVSDAPFLSLPVAGFAPSLVAIPTDPARPVLVATHGHGEPPDEICRVFQALVKNRGYVLCLAGTRWPISGVYTYLSERALGEELDAAMIALHARFPEADQAAAVYAGFSMGASFGVGPLVERAQRFPRALMIEGGVTDWSAARVRGYAARGGLRVLFACGLRRRLSQANAIATSMRAQGLAAEVIVGEDAAGQEAGHTYGGDVARVIGEHFTWLIEGDARWAE